MSNYLTRAIKYLKPSAEFVITNEDYSTIEWHNAGNGTYGDMLEMGVIDPTKVTKTALQNAASIAGLILTTDCSVVELKKPESTRPENNLGGMM